MAVPRFGIAATLVVGLALAGLGQSKAPLDLGELRPLAAGSNHAAIVIDTGSEVKKFCLAFPEEEITGAEALRRIDAQVVFANFGSRGQAVCSLCGTGCPSSDCFCDPARFWAYHRAGPGGTSYRYSRAGASSTTVRHGDVEGWKWGGGEAPPAATVSEVCNIEEPPPRTTSGPTTSAPTTSTTTSTTTLRPAEPPSTTIGAATQTPTTVTPSTTPTSSDEAAPAPTAAELEEEAAAPSAAKVKRSLEAVDGAAAPAEDKWSPATAAADNLRDRAEAVAFVALLGGILAWKARLRRSKVRRGDSLG